ncbi:MAG: class I tRNA ligase family protein, partial [Candidatus Pacearchaeota archaeon]|nr:class I tRNA ligase family protein [Candidatus Pacearchaeota archaeon]
MGKKFYVTTAIDYTNDVIHIGQAYQKVVADVFARWYRLLGKRVFFLTGTDEHGKKIYEIAKERGLNPKEFVDVISTKDKEEQDSLNISYDRFIRTTDKDHEKIVQEVTKKILKKGDIYKGIYEGLYCVGCEAYLTEKDLSDGKCPVHDKKPEVVKEETYFFRLSKYKKKLLKYYEKHPEFILPEERRNEIISKVKEGVKDLSITRTTVSWGIPFPGDEKHTIYVWWDALLNYFSGIYSEKKFWPPDLQLLGKDNGWFHGVVWPAMLMSAGLKLPKKIFIHGFLTFEGKKISKSLGNIIHPKELVKKYGSDSVRYFLCRNFALG